LVTSPYISLPSQLGIQGFFIGFPPTFIHYGDAERLEKEIEMLVLGMKRDGVRVESEKTRTVDGVHDLLMVRFRNDGVREGVYRKIRSWLQELGA
jgi:acetyl esterase/lipase